MLGVWVKQFATTTDRRLEDSRDKTEFWVPALPWRAIYYPNSKGSEAKSRDFTEFQRVLGSSMALKPLFDACAASGSNSFCNLVCGACGSLQWGVGAGLEKRILDASSPLESN